MSSYLLSWNPKNFSTGGEGSDQGTLDYQKDEVVRWSCHSKQVAKGDHVYLIKLGKGSRGIIAKGVVTKASYIDKCWKDATKERTYIDFRVEDIRHNCNEGLVPQVLLLKTCPEQQWSPQSSGISIKPEYEDTVNWLWNEGASLHSLTLYFSWISQYEKYPKTWYKSYTDMCELGKSLKESQQIADDELERIWVKRENGIASVGQGFMYKKEFSANREYLSSVTLDVINDPSQATYDRLHNEWRTEGDFGRTLWSVIRRVFALADPEHLTSIVGDEYLDFIFSLLNEQFELGISRSKHWFNDNASLIEATSPFIPNDINFIRRNILLWLLYEYSQPSKSNLSDSGTDNTANFVAESTVGKYEGTAMTASLNQILYGPPGTGKTYHSIQAAVKAAEPEIFSALGIDESSSATSEQRAELTRLYKELYNAGRIRFVTFHQSYGYEEFVEGLKASSDDGNISYDVEDGVFKAISIQAEKFSKPKEAESNFSFEKAWQVFTEQLSEEEFVEVQMSKTSFKVLDFNDSRIFFEKKSGSQDHTLSISTLRAIFEERREYNSGLGVYYRPLVKYLKELSEPEQMSAIERQNFVLIIDEINRGNISKIFGELITLIEPSKRLGQSEAIEVTLPYSGDKFSVPDNLYIIGTMNTADRSLALMDTALRRRFDFIEMMPDYNVLHNEEGSSFKVESDGFEIDLARLLETMNKRIAALYDREHQLGHAFLMPVVKAIAAGDDEKALHELKSCFQNKIIPLLAEYFFEDWQKIRLVVGDNQKPEAYQLINQSDVDYEVLFGDTEDVGDVADEVQDFRLIKSDSERWTDPLTYIGIYSAGSLTFSNQDEG
jgi:5-methylcytosine-specific restriction protein B|tara:strand:+ start:1864 stop:4371 length:2508 start_codon:yes stop_codon:yes gene_type:complete